MKERKKTTHTQHCVVAVPSPLPSSLLIWLCIPFTWTYVLVFLCDSVASCVIIRARCRRFFANAMALGSVPFLCYSLSFTNTCAPSTKTSSLDWNPSTIFRIHLSTKHSFITFMLQWSGIKCNVCGGENTKFNSWTKFFQKCYRHINRKLLWNEAIELAAQLEKNNENIRKMYT